MSMTNREIASIFGRIADLMELQKGDSFKIRSYRGASELIAELSTPLSEMAAKGGAAELRKLPGVGEAISKKIIDILDTGTTKAYEDLKAEIPETLLDLLRIDGIGMKTVDILYHQFHISNLDDFKKFVDGGGLLSVPRLGEKTRARIQKSLEKM
jgi:DNA polymerase (family X)